MRIRTRLALTRTRHDLTRADHGPRETVAADVG